MVMGKPRSLGGLFMAQKIVIYYMNYISVIKIILYHTIQHNNPNGDSTCTLSAKAKH